MKRSATIIGVGLIILASGAGYAINQGNVMLDNMHAGKMTLQRLAPQVTASPRLTATVWDDTSESVMTIFYESEPPEYIGSLRAISPHKIAGMVQNQDCTSTSINDDEHRISDFLRKHRFPAPGQCAKTISFKKQDHLVGR